MYTTIEDFLRDWDYEWNATVKMIRSIDEKKFHLKPHPDVRSCAQLSSHIALTIAEMLSKTGLNFEHYDEDSDCMWTVKEVSHCYETFARDAAQLIRSNWNDEKLKESINMYGETCTHAGVLSSLIKHQIHHRGQLSVVMRLLDMPVHGIYGPAREEWAAMGLPEME
ncbi:MAG: DinB family protein [Bacteroidia bacterium]